MRKGSVLVFLVLLLAFGAIASEVEFPDFTGWTQAEIQAWQEANPGPVFIPGERRSELDEGPYLVCSTYSTTQTYCRFTLVLQEMDIDYDYYYDYYGNWQNQPLEDYGTVLTHGYYGYRYAAGWEAMDEFVSAGGKMIEWGMYYCYDATWPTGMGTFVNGNGGQYTYWQAGSPSFILEDPTHPLAVDLPDEATFYSSNQLYAYQIDDDEFETVATSSLGDPTFGVISHGSGDFIYIAYYGYYNYWNSYPNDGEVLDQMIMNSVNYVRGSKVYGYINEAGTLDEPVADVICTLFDATADTVVDVDTSDAEGYYEFHKRLLEGMEYYATYEKAFYVTHVEEDIDFTIPDDVILNIQFIPFLVANIEVVQTEVALDTWVDVTGIVTVPTNSIDMENTSFYIQDETGYGINVWDFGPWPRDGFYQEDLMRGDEIRVVGRLDEIDGVAQITDIYDFTFISTGNEAPAPLRLSTGAMSAMQDMEGSLGTVSGYLQDDPFQGDFLVRLDDGSGSVWVHVYQSSGLDDMNGYGEDDWFYVTGAISIYEGNVQLVPSVEGDIWRTPMVPPVFFRTAVDEETGSVDIKWEHTGIAVIEHLMYDDNDPVTTYRWVDSTFFANHISPQAGCRLMSLDYWITSDEGGMFTASAWRWSPENNAPGTYNYFTRDIQVAAGTHGWVSVWTVDDAVNVDGDFVAGFGFHDDDVRLGVDTERNDRAWDYDGENWSAWRDTYYIRAVVQYTNGVTATIGGGEDELDAWQAFNVYRNGEMIEEEISDPEFMETLPAYGSYYYTISAIYHEGESAVGDTVWVEWDEPQGAVDASTTIPTEWAIQSAYPNPFNPTVNIVVAVPEASKLHAEVFDMLGRSVAVLENGSIKPGYHNMTWTAEGSSGIYFLRVSSETGWSDIRKLVFMK